MKVLFISCLFFLTTFVYRVKHVTLGWFKEQPVLNGTFGIVYNHLYTQTSQSNSHLHPNLTGKFTFTPQPQSQIHLYTTTSQSNSPFHHNITVNFTFTPQHHSQIPTQRKKQKGHNPWCQSAKWHKCLFGTVLEMAGLLSFYNVTRGSSKMTKTVRI